jgi:hypothetical protein
VGKGILGARGSDIFHEDGDSMKGPTEFALLALGVESRGYSSGIRVHLDDGAEVGVCL